MSKMLLCKLCWCVLNAYNEEEGGALGQWQDSPGINWIVCEDCIKKGKAS